jgi:glycosyltransferase involved in cell wall biosynthesis
MSHPSVAVLIPCYNEEAAIGDMIRAFRQTLPEASIYVYDNNSTDATVQKAREAGAVVRLERRQGKGHVVRRMFADIDADIYLMIDGDGTYDIASAPALIHKLQADHLDMVVATRQGADSLYRMGHAFGNRLFNFLLKISLNSPFSDIFSGYRVFSRRFVKSFPALTKGFDIETELCVHAIELMLPVDEMPTPFYLRTEGSQSKLSTWKDGLKIFYRMFILLRDNRPLLVFGAATMLCIFLGLMLGFPLVQTYCYTGLVPRLPTAFITVGLMIMACLNLYTGIILNSLSRQKREVKRLFYLNLSKN